MPLCFSCARVTGSPTSHGDAKAKASENGLRPEFVDFFLGSLERGSASHMNTCPNVRMVYMPRIHRPVQPL